MLSLPLIIEDPVTCLPWPPAPAAHTEQMPDLALGLGTCLPNMAIDVVQSFQCCCENSGPATTSPPAHPSRGPLAGTLARTADGLLSCAVQPSAVPGASQTSHQRPVEPLLLSQVFALCLDSPEFQAHGPTCLPDLTMRTPLEGTQTCSPIQRAPHLLQPQCPPSCSGQTPRVGLHPSLPAHTASPSFLPVSTLKPSLLSTPVPVLATITLPRAPHQPATCSPPLLWLHSPSAPTTRGLPLGPPQPLPPLTLPQPQ